MRYWIFFALFGLIACNTPKTEIQTSEFEDEFSGRLAWEEERLADPATGKIPEGIKKRELAFAQKLPKDIDFPRRKTSVWQQVGPYNIGGRTRAAAIDINNENIILAAGVSGGMWRSTDQGKTWSRTSAANQHHSVTCLAQDKRQGKTNIWYYGSGEGIGNSASKSFSANYLGDGVYKSIDNGLTWSPLPATQSNSPQSPEPWDIIWNVVVDHIIDTADVLYVAKEGRIMKSTNGGKTFRMVLGPTSVVLASYTDIAISPNGVKYATLSSNGAVRGIYRSLDGENWANITPSNFPASYNRIVMAFDSWNENRVYFLANTINEGKPANPNDLKGERNMLWRYLYKSGDGAGANGNWTDLSENIPSGTSFRTRFQSQGSYNMAIAVKPDDPNVVFIAGTNMYRSDDAFTTPNKITHIGGYNPGQTSTFEYRYPKSHPDFHVISFLQSNPNHCFTANDGGCYITRNVMADSVVWEDLNTGFFTTQFYTIHIDHKTKGSNVIVGGMQDNSTAWTKTLDKNIPWQIPSGGDGSYAAIGNGGEDYYFSSQLGRTYKMKLDSNGNRVAWRRIDPKNGQSYLFVNPFIIDPADNNVMYMAEYNNVWRNLHLDSIVLDETNSKLEGKWERISSNTSNQRVCALRATFKNPEHRLYVGTTDRDLYVWENAIDTPVFRKITQKLGSGTWVSDIAVHPEDGDKIMLVYSNYNAYSLYYSEDGGENWEKISGNFESEIPDGLPPSAHGFGDGPSLRCAAFVPVGNEIVYLVGASTGLYATKKLDGDSTVWVQQVTQEIGNCVVDMLDVRAEDGFVAVGTHGRGAFAAYITDLNQIVGIEDIKKYEQSATTLKVYPNPANNYLSIKVNANEFNNANIFIYNLQGKLVKTTNFLANQPIDVNDLPNGVYSLYLQASNKAATAKFVVSR